MWKLFNKLAELFKPSPITQKATSLVPRLPAGGQRWVVADVHGCARTFQKLVTSLNLSHKDQLFLLGDYVNRGPDSAGVLDFIFYLQKQKYQVFPLVGNHEIMLLEANRNKYILKNFVQKYYTHNLLDPKTEKLKPEYERFILSLPYYYILDDYVLVHAGFNFAAFDPLQDFEAMLYIRNFKTDEHFLQGRQVIHGHTPKPIATIQHHINTSLSTIPLDNGCVYHGKREQQGNLVAFNLKTQELVIQQNIDVMVMY